MSAQSFIIRLKAQTIIAAICLLVVAAVSVRILWIPSKKVQQAENVLRSISLEGVIDPLEVEDCIVDEPDWLPGESQPFARLFIHIRFPKDAMIKQLEQAGFRACEDEREKMDFEARVAPLRVDSRRCAGFYAKDQTVRNWSRVWLEEESDGNLCLTIMAWASSAEQAQTH